MLGGGSRRRLEPNPNAALDKGAGHAAKAVNDTLASVKWRSQAWKPRLRPCRGSAIVCMGLRFRWTSIEKGKRHGFISESAGFQQG